MIPLPSVPADRSVGSAGEASRDRSRGSETRSRVGRANGHGYEHATTPHTSRSATAPAGPRPGCSPAGSPCYKRRPVSIDRIPLPSHVPGRLFATGFTDVGPDPEAALASVDGDVLLCL